MRLEAHLYGERAAVERRRRGARLREGSGQAALELVVAAGFLAVLLAVGLQVIATAGAQWQAQSAAYAGARAEAVGEDGERRALGVLAAPRRAGDPRPRPRHGLTVRAREGRVGVDLSLPDQPIGARVRAAAALSPMP